MSTTLNDLQKQILNEIKAEIKRDGNLSIREFAKNHYVSPAFLVKLSKKLGYSGYKELIFSLKMDSNKQEREGEDEYLTKIENLIFENYNDEMARTFREYFENSFDHYIYAGGKGYSDVVIDFISRKCIRRGYRLVYTENLDELPHAEDTKNIGLLISASGETEDVIEIAQTCKKLNLKTIAFTQNRNSRLGRMVDLPIVISKFEGDNDGRINVFVSYTIMAFEILLKKKL